jgi:hypothetical protein
MLQVYMEAFKARATSLRARRVAKCFQGPYERVSCAIFFIPALQSENYNTKSTLKYLFPSNLCH